MAKLQYMERIARQVGNVEPPRKRGTPDITVADMEITVGEFYRHSTEQIPLFEANLDADLAAMWKESLRAMNAHLADDTPGGLWYGQVDMTTGARTATEFGALHAFLPAVLALGGDLGRARRLQESAYRMWTLHGIEPDLLDYRTMQVKEAASPLRPEIVESAYYLYRYTRDPRYLEMGRTFFMDLLAHCRTEEGYTVLKDVVTKEKGDLMPSYFLAETLKYLYLLFAPEETLDLRKVVLNTEAHPLERRW